MQHVPHPRTALFEKLGRINGADAWPFGRVPYVDAVTYQ
jgi:hypothetical protein